MERINTRGALYSLVIILACGGETPAVETPVLPDLSGNWTMTIVAYPDATPNGAGGACTLASPLPFTLGKQTSQGDGDFYLGTHALSQLRCTGLTTVAAEHAGLTDSVFALPANGMTVISQLDGVYMQIAGFGFSAEDQSQSSMTGSMTWRDPAGVERMHGSWSAGR